MTESFNTFEIKNVIMIELEALLQNLINTFGLPVVLVLLFSRGLLIGKIFPSITLISMYILFIGNTNITFIIFICIITAIATTSGEFIVFSQSKNPNESVSAYVPDRFKPTINNEDNSHPWINKISSRFSNNMGVTIFITNITMGLRGFSSIPAGKSQYSSYKFFTISYTSNVIYHITFTYIFITGFSLIF